MMTITNDALTSRSLCRHGVSRGVSSGRTRDGALPKRRAGERSGVLVIALVVVAVIAEARAGAAPCQPMRPVTAVLQHFTKRGGARISRPAGGGTGALGETQKEAPPRLRVVGAVVRPAGGGEGGEGGAGSRCGDAGGAGGNTMVRLLSARVPSMRCGARRQKRLGNGKRRGSCKPLRVE